jgi:hypothetical protein
MVVSDSGFAAIAAPQNDRGRNLMVMGPRVRGDDDKEAGNEGLRLRSAPANDQNRPAPKTKVLVQLQRDSTCPVVAAKIFRFASCPNQTYNSRHPAPPEGRIAIVTDVGCGMRWTRGRTRRMCPSRTVKSCGPDTSTPVSNWRRCLRIAPVTVTTKPDRRGEHEGNR